MLLTLALSLLGALGAHAEINNESEVGVVITSGNSRVQSLSFKQGNRYEFGPNSLAFNGTFLQTKSQGILSAKRWDLQLRYERKFTDVLSGILSQGVQSDSFAGYLQRINTDVGPKYIILREVDVWEWNVETTYRYSFERKIDGNRLPRHQARFFTEVKRQWSPTASSRFFVEWIPNVRRVSDWEARAELSSSAALTSVFSLKATYLLKYDNLPAVDTALKRDSEFTTSIVAKF